MMSPALAHGARPGCVGLSPWPPGPRSTPFPVASDVTRTVRLPLPIIGWRRKENVSTTASPPGPIGTGGGLGVMQVGEADPGPVVQTPVCGEPTHANTTISAPATPMRIEVSHLVAVNEVDRSR